MATRAGYARAAIDDSSFAESNDDGDVFAELGPRENDGSTLYVGNGLETKEERKRRWWRSGTINALFIAVWFTTAITLSVYNKWMFSPDRYGFAWPISSTAYQMFVQFALAALVRRVWARRFKPPFNPSKKDYVQKVAPTALATGLDIGLSNFSLKLITLSFYTMCKSSSLIFVLIFAFAFRLEVFSLRLVGVILLIFVGVLMMVATEAKFELLGFILITTASALSGLRWSLTHLLLKDERMGLNNPAATIFWLAPLMGISLTIASFCLESWRELVTSKFFGNLSSTFNTVFFLSIPGCIAFLMIITEYTIIQRAGVVPMSIAGIAKEVSQISISAWLFGDELSPLNIVGVAITVSGIFLFTYHKYRKSVDGDGDSQARYTSLGRESGISFELREREAASPTFDSPTGPRPTRHPQGDVLFDAGNTSGTSPGIAHDESQSNENGSASGPWVGHIGV